MTNRLYIKNKEEREQAKEDLREVLERSGRTVYQSIGHVSKSGMYRTIKNMIIIDGTLRNIDWQIARVMDYVTPKEDGLGVTGCGMDMGFDIVYNLGRTLYPKGDGKTLTHRNGEKNTLEYDGGYLITPRWV